MYNILRNDGIRREAAALHLGRHGGPEGQRALLYVLSAWDRSASERYVYGSRKIWVRKEHNRAAHRQDRGFLERAHKARGSAAVSNNYHYVPDAEHERIDLGTRLEVCEYGEAFRTVLLEALDLSESRETGRSPATWLETLDPGTE